MAQITVLPFLPVLLRANGLHVSHVVSWLRRARAHRPPGGRGGTALGGQRGRGLVVQRRWHAALAHLRAAPPVSLAARQALQQPPLATIAALPARAGRRPAEVMGNYMGLLGMGVVERHCSYSDSTNVPEQAQTLAQHAH